MLALGGCAGVISAAVDESVAIRSSATPTPTTSPAEAIPPVPTPVVLVPPPTTVPVKVTKVITYEVVSDAKLNALTYYDELSDPAKAPGVSAPWTKTVVNDAPVAVAGLSAQTTGRSITCRITVDGVVKDEQTAVGKFAAVNCSGQ
ncbi:hypothetical protein IU476_10920 [Nocardia blacklockiae]|nr:hypothetical protein [Nocardia blacklockiae]